MNSATSKVTIQHLRTVFAQFGIPDCIVTDNGTCFTSGEFEEYLVSRTRSRHLTILPLMEWQKEQFKS